MEDSPFSRAKKLNDFIRTLAAGGSTRAFAPLLTQKEYDHYLHLRMGLSPAAALAMAVRDEAA